MPRKSKGKLKPHNVDRKVSQFAEAEVFRNSAAVLDDTDPHESLKYMKEIFKDKLDEDVVVMIFSECAYDVDQAFETLMSLCNEDNEKSSFTSQVRGGSNSVDATAQENPSLISKPPALCDYSSQENVNCQYSDLASSKDYGSRNLNPSDMKSDVLPLKQNYCSEMPPQVTNYDPFISASLPENSSSLFKPSDAFFNDNTYFSPNYFKRENSPSSGSVKDSSSLQYLPSSVPQFITPLLPTPIYKLGSPVFHRSAKNANSHSVVSEKIHTSATSLGESKKKVENPIKNIVEKIKAGRRVLIILRGLPGSGKSTLGRKLRFSGAVYSTDDFFIKRGKYVFDCTKLSEAHEWNRRRTKKALERGISPVIIDNTNVEAWEISPYILLGRKYRYEIFILEPDTPWKFNVRELYLRNRHGVSKEKIAKMKERYQHNITVENMIKSLQQSNSLNCLETSKSDFNSNHFETNHGMNKCSTENENISSAVIHPKPSDSNIDTKETGSEASNLSTDTYISAEDLLLLNVELLYNPLISKQQESLHHSDVSNQSESPEKFETDESLVIGNLDDLKALILEDSEDSQSHIDSANGSNQDIACWEAITEHDDDFLWSTSPEKLNKPFFNDHNFNNDTSLKKDERYKSINTFQEPSVELNFNQQDQNIVVSPSKYSNLNEIFSETDVNECEVPGSNSLELAASSQNLLSDSQKCYSENNACNDDKIINYNSLKSRLFLFSKENNIKNQQSAIEIPENEKNRFDFTRIDKTEGEINPNQIDMKQNLTFSPSDTSSLTESELDDKLTNTRESSCDHEFNYFSKQGMNWDIDGSSVNDNIGAKKTVGQFDVMCPKPQRNDASLNPEFSFTFNKTFIKNNNSTQILESIDDPNKDKIYLNWEISEFDASLQNSECVIESTENNFIESETLALKHEKQICESKDNLFRNNEVINNNSVKENNSCKQSEDKKLLIQSASDVKIHEKKACTKKGPFFEHIANDIGSDWKFPDYVESNNECSDEYERIVPKMSCSSQTEPSDFVLLYKIAKGNDISCDYQIVIPSENAEVAIISDLGHIQDLESNIFSKSPKFEKSTSTDDMPDDLEIEQKLYQLHECFSDIAEEDLKHLLEMCHNNDTWLSNLLIEWGYKYNVATDEKFNDSTLYDSLNGSADSNISENQNEIRLNTSVTGSVIKNSSNPKAFCDNESNSVIESNVISEKQSENYTKIDTFPAPRSFKKLQFVLDPAFAYQLEEFFGPVVNRIPSDSLSTKQRCVNIDFEFAKLIYDKWKQTVHGVMKADNIADAAADAEDLPISDYKENIKGNASTSLTRNSNEPLPLSEIMDMEYALQLHKQEKLKKDTDFATKLKRLELYNMFPGADTVALDEIFESNNFSLKNSVMALGEDFDQPQNIQKEKDVEKIDKCVAEWSESNCFQDFENDNWTDWVYKEENIGSIKEAVIPFSPPYICPEALKLRELATEHYHLRQECIRKAQSAYCRGMKDVASFYAQQGKEHGLKFKEANKEASELIAKQRNTYTAPLVLDLHGLYIQEAIPTLEKFLRDRKLELKRRQQTFPQTISVITGQGIHSMRGPKLRPSVMEFLKKTGYRYIETNPGMVDVTIFPE